MDIRITLGETQILPKEENGFFSYHVQTVACQPSPMAPLLQGFPVNGSTVEMNYDSWQTFCTRFAYPDLAEKCGAEVPVVLSEENGTRLQRSALQKNGKQVMAQYEQTLQALFEWLFWWMDFVGEHCERPSISFFLPDW